MALQELDLMCNSIEADGAERISKSLHVSIFDFMLKVLLLSLGQPWPNG